MCGRYTLTKTSKDAYPESLLDTIENLVPLFEGLPRFNAAPSQLMPVFCVRDGRMRVDPMAWSLVPHWSTDGKSRFSTINARCENVENSKLYAPYFKKARCLVPADGFFEWKKEPPDSGKPAKMPFYISRPDRKVFMMAGLFSIWRDADQKEHPTYSILTCPANKTMSRLHHRMPVILDETHYQAWLDRDNQDTGSLKNLLQPAPDGFLEFYPVSRRVNSPGNDNHACLDRIDD